MINFDRSPAKIGVFFLLSLFCVFPLFVLAAPEANGADDERLGLGQPDQPPRDDESDDDSGKTTPNTFGPKLRIRLEEKLGKANPSDGEIEIIKNLDLRDLGDEVGLATLEGIDRFDNLEPFTVPHRHPREPLGETVSLWGP